MLKLLSKESLDFNLDEVLRLGAKKMLLKALEAEVSEVIDKYKDEVDENGHRAVVRNGKSKSRKLTLPSGSIEIQAPRINDRRKNEKFISQVLPPYIRKSPKVESLMPALYLRGISTGKMSGVFEEFFGKGSMGLSPATVSKLIKTWEKDFDEFKKRVIRKRYVYIWADGVNVKIRLGDDKKVCLLVIIGVREDGSKELLACEEGYRESTEAWSNILRSLVERGLKAPMLAIGDGALGFWSAVRGVEEFEDTKEQRCWVHKIKNVLNLLPKRVQTEAKSLLHEMMKAPDRESAEKAKTRFENIFKAKYEKSVVCINKDWKQLTTFFDFPAEHWVSLRTTNPIESSFATVKLRTKSTRGAGSPKTAATMAFKLLQECEKSWRKIRGFREIEKMLSGIEFKDGVMINQKEQNQEAAAM